MIILILILLLIIALVILYNPANEQFSTSGLAISDADCQKLVDVYYRPNDHSPVCRDDYTRRICGYQRRNTVDPQTGNYYTSYGQLL
ncbi:MAG: hypothetical protein Homavirus38_2 [Homavirus sp.]|uniref:Uncharacterized protein n=1 Tax=Homavirus sp. TaxID=2487769 RepID=A0A3G5A5A6_9VIRU|nr:MAG: hypothetical protein Homavirus38_2 [Homavirus sp.]